MGFFFAVGIVVTNCTATGSPGVKIVFCMIVSVHGCVIKSGFTGGGEPSIKPPHQPKSPSLALFYGVRFRPTDSKVFLKAHLAPRNIHFEKSTHGENTIFLVKTYQKRRKHFFGLFEKLRGALFFTVLSTVASIINLGFRLTIQSGV